MILEAFSVGFVDPMPVQTRGGGQLYVQTGSQGSAAGRLAFLEADS